MNHKKIEKTKAEIKRLLQTIEDLQSECTNASDPRNGYYFGYPKLTGAVRRASMDVTRTLADLRKPS